MTKALEKLTKVIPKLFTTLLLSLFLLSVIPTTALAFGDVSTNHTHYFAITGLQNKNIIKGYNDGTFKPENPINRAEFLKIVVGASAPNQTSNQNNCFPDVRTEWFAPFVCFAKVQNIVGGYPDGTFKPARNITVPEALKIALTGFNVTLQDTTTTNWYAKYMTTANNNNLLNKINPTLAHAITRGEAAQLIYNVMKFQDPTAFPPEPEPPSPTPTPPTQNTANTYSWNGSWNPAPTDFPLAGLLDPEYNTNPSLPPGKWDYNNANNDLANWRNFEQNIGTFSPLLDTQNRQYGWKLNGNNPDAVDFSGPAEYLLGSSGTDIINLGRNGTIHSMSGGLGDGPDILAFDKSYALDYRTGSSTTGSSHDDDLVIAGCSNRTDTDFNIKTTTIHTGPGSDLVFGKNMSASAIDAGNGNGGNTSVLDPNDGNDTVVFKGNMYDFRFFGGKGDDTVIWYADEVNQSAQWLGPNFFGGGGSGDALWNDPGTDTLVMAIPSTTPITTVTPTAPGSLLVRIDKNYPQDIVWDEPTVNDPNAKYCITCGTSPDGRKTITMEYNSTNGKVHTGYFTVTAFKRLQIGLGDEAKVYDLNQFDGTVRLNESAKKISAPEVPGGDCG